MTAPSDRFSQFSDVVTSPDELEATLGAPMPQVIDKVTDYLDDVCRDFIARSPFCLVASRSSDGPVDISPKGDPAGFAKVLDQNYLAIPDRPGNRRADTFHNVLKDPRVGLIFIIPGKGETLRISGEARIVRDPNLLESMAMNSKTPAFALVVHVDRAFTHCPKCVVRSKIWQPDSWPNSQDLPDIGNAMIKQGKLDISPEDLFEEAQKADVLRLY